MPIIEFRRVSKRYADGSTALSDVSFSVEEGEFLFLCGPSGAGKSTLLKLIPAIECTSGGAVFVNGQNIGSLQASALPYLRRRMGLVLHEFGLLADRSVLANIALPLLVTGLPSDQALVRARAALEKVGLLEKAGFHPPALSGGEQQRAEIARAIVHMPRIILADEPTANLDAHSAERVMDALLTFRRAGVTCLVATHDERFLSEADRVLRLEGGRLRSSAREPADEARR